MTNKLILTVWLMVWLAPSLKANNLEAHDVTVKHTVKAGENLHRITRQYLGTDILWQENWKLNPHIDNPNKLKIGQELTIIKERVIPAEKARVFNVINRVEKKPAGSDWLSAEEGDELIQQEGVRTYAKSSALLEFNDESQLKVLEYSQIFLQSRSTDLKGVDSATIEVVKGDAELNWEPLESTQTELIIVTGGTVSKPQAQAGKVAALRTGVTASGTSVISVYQGNSAVASAGAEVKVKQGMGVAVKPGEIPPEPKPLLPAPDVTGSQESIFNYLNPIIMWSEVDGAAEYVVEMCQDESCNQVIKQVALKANQWQVDDISQQGKYYFRVAAKSADELVGFRSESRMIEFTSAEPDQLPPMIAIDLSGPKNYESQQLVIGPNSEVTLIVVDELSGISEIEYKWNDGSWQSYHNKALNLPVMDSILYIKAIDQLGQSAEVSYQFINQ